MKKENENWFPVRRLHMWIAVSVFLIIVLSINPITYNKVINDTALINWLLMVIMFVCLIAMLIDNLSAEKKIEQDSTEKPNTSNSQEKRGGSL